MPHHSKIWNKTTEISKKNIWRGPRKTLEGQPRHHQKKIIFYLLFISINYQEPFTIHGPRWKQCYVSGNKSINYTHQILYTSANGVIQGHRRLLNIHTMFLEMDDQHWEKNPPSLKITGQKKQKKGKIYNHFVPKKTELWSQNSILGFRYLLTHAFDQNTKWIMEN